MQEVFEFLFALFKWLSLGLGLIFLLGIWLGIIFIVADEAHSLYLEFRDRHDTDEFGEY